DQAGRGRGTSRTRATCRDRRRCAGGGRRRTDSVDGSSHGLADGGGGGRPPTAELLERRLDHLANGDRGEARRVGPRDLPAPAAETQRGEEGRERLPNAVRLQE